MNLERRSALHRYAPWAFLAATLSAALAAGAEPPALPPVAPAQLTVRVEVERNGHLEVVAAGDRLRSGERIHVLAAADRDVYLYLLQFFADGAAAVLHPEEGDLILQAGYSLRLPATGSWFVLDDAVGEENLYFVASAGPIAEVDALVAARLREVRASPGGAALGAELEKPVSEPAAVAPAATEAPRDVPAKGGIAPSHRRARAEPALTGTVAPSVPGGFGLGNRGLIRVAGREGVVVELDAGGVAIYRLHFQHVPR